MPRPLSGTNCAFVAKFQLQKNVQSQNLEDGTVCLERRGKSPPQVIPSGKDPEIPVWRGEKS